TRARLYYASLARNPSQIPALPSQPDARYDVPVSGPTQLVDRGLPLDEIEDVLPQSAAYRQAKRILFAEPVSATGRPLTPLHAGHVGLLACSGLLNGIFGSGDERHIAFWQAVKIVDKTEEEDEQGIITMREKERFSNDYMESAVRYVESGSDALFFLKLVLLCYRLSCCPRLIGYLLGGGGRGRRGFRSISASSAVAVGKNVVDDSI
ncbi:MAG: hypothetical protein ABSH49_34170, partial [Bryobacteraceae bacterium]